MILIRPFSSVANDWPQQHDVVTNGQIIAILIAIGLWLAQVSVIVLGHEYTERRKK